MCSQSLGEIGRRTAGLTSKCALILRFNWKRAKIDILSSVPQSPGEGWLGIQMSQPIHLMPPILLHAWTRPLHRVVSTQTPMRHVPTSPLHTPIPLPPFLLPKCALTRWDQEFKVSSWLTFLINYFVWLEQLPSMHISYWCNIKICPCVAMPPTGLTLTSPLQDFSLEREVRIEKQAPSCFPPQFPRAVPCSINLSSFFKSNILDNSWCHGLLTKL